MKYCKPPSISELGDKMIIPTPEFDPMFADDGVSFRTKMIEYIKREFADLLGPSGCVLQGDEGLDDLSTLTTVESQGSTQRFAA